MFINLMSFAVATGSKKECQAAKSIKLSQQSGYVASSVTEDTGVGSVHCPLVIKVKEGQRVNLTLYNFAKDTHFMSNNALLNARPKDVCYKIAEVHEPTGKRQITICEGEQRIRPMHISKGSTMTLHIINRRLLSAIGAFIFHYEGTYVNSISRLR